MKHRRNSPKSFAVLGHDTGLAEAYDEGVTQIVIEKDVMQRQVGVADALGVHVLQAWTQGAVGWAQHAASRHVHAEKGRRGRA